MFREVMSGNPTHLDTHQHVHRDPPVSSVMLAMAAELNVPLRHFTSAVRYCGRFYGRHRSGDENPAAVTTPGLLHVVDELDDGVTELCCHPAAEPQAGEEY